MPKETWIPVFLLPAEVFASAHGNCRTSVQIHMCRYTQDMVKTVTGVFLNSLRWEGELKCELLIVPDNKPLARQDKTTPHVLIGDELVRYSST